MPKVLISHRSQESHCAVTLSVSELPDNKLKLELTAAADIRNSLGEKYEHSTVRYFCGEGLSYARRRLGLEAGISVDIKYICGIIADGTETSVSYAVAIAIAETLRRGSYKAILDDEDEWEVTFPPYRKSRQ